MPSRSFSARNRWYQVLWPGQPAPTYAWAERYFDNHTEAFDHYDRHLAERPAERVHPPLRSHEDEEVWVVCVDPV